MLRDSKIVSPQVIAKYLFPAFLFFRCGRILRSPKFWDKLLRDIVLSTGHHILPGAPIKKKGVPRAAIYRSCFAWPSYARTGLVVPLNTATKTVRPTHGLTIHSNTPYSDWRCSWQARPSNQYIAPQSKSNGYYLVLLSIYPQSYPV